MTKREEENTARSLAYLQDKYGRLLRNSQFADGVVLFDPFLGEVLLGPDILARGTRAVRYRILHTQLLLARERQRAAAAVCASLRREISKLVNS